MTSGPYVMSRVRMDLASSRSQSLLLVVFDQLRVHLLLSSRRSGSNAPGRTELRSRLDHLSLDGAGLKEASSSLAAEFFVSAEGRDHLV